MHNNNSFEGRSVLALLRSLVPKRSLQSFEALRLAELQANRLLETANIGNWPVPSEIVTELPRMRIEHRDLPTSGLSFWDGQAWVIYLNAAEATTRQRFTLLHEFKHVIDHGRSGHLYSSSHRHTADEQAEQAADYFAGCVLMPKRLFKRAWGEGRQRPACLGGALRRLATRGRGPPLTAGTHHAQAAICPVSGVRCKVRPEGIYFRRSSASRPISQPLRGAAA